MRTRRPDETMHECSSRKDNDGRRAGRHIRRCTRPAAGRRHGDAKRASRSVRRSSRGPVCRPGASKNGNIPTCATCCATSRRLPAAPDQAALAAAAKPSTRSEGVMREAASSSMASSRRSVRSDVGRWRDRACARAPCSMARPVRSGATCCARAMAIRSIALNTAFATDGVLIDVADDARSARPLHIVACRGTPEHGRIHAVAGPYRQVGAAVTLVESFVATGRQRLSGP